MNLQEKLLLLRRQNGYSQERLADKLMVSRQTIGKWESGQAIPELYRIIELSELYGVSSIISCAIRDAISRSCNL